MPLAALVADGSQSAATARTVPELLAAQAALRAAQVVSRLGESGDAALSPTAVFAAPTVAELAARLVDAGNAQSAPPIPPLVRRARGASPNLKEGSAATKSSIRGE